MPSVYLNVVHVHSVQRKGVKERENKTTALVQAILLRKHVPRVSRDGRWDSGRLSQSGTLPASRSATISLGWVPCQCLKLISWDVASSANQPLYLVLKQKKSSRHQRKANGAGLMSHFHMTPPVEFWRVILTTCACFLTPSERFIITVQCGRDVVVQSQIGVHLRTGGWNAYFSWILVRVRGAGWAKAPLSASIPCPFTDGFSDQPGSPSVLQWSCVALCLWNVQRAHILTANLISANRGKG